MTHARIARAKTVRTRIRRSNPKSNNDKTKNIMVHYISRYINKYEMYSINRCEMMEQNMNNDVPVCIHYTILCSFVLFL